MLDSAMSNPSLECDIAFDIAFTQQFHKQEMNSEWQFGHYIEKCCLFWLPGWKKILKKPDLLCSSGSVTNIDLYIHVINA